MLTGLFERIGAWKTTLGGLILISVYLLYALGYIPAERAEELIKLLLGGGVALVLAHDKQHRGIG